MTNNQLFERLISILRINDIRYAITGRTEGYPSEIDSDVDIIIPRSQIKKFHTVIWNIENEKTHVVQMLQHEIVAFYYVVSHLSGNGIVYIKPDVCTDYYRKGIKFMDANYLLEGRMKAPQGGFMVLSHEKEFIYYLLKKIDKKSVSTEQFEHIRNHYLQAKSLCDFEIRKIWEKNERSIVLAALESDDVSLISDNIHVLRNAIHISKNTTWSDTLLNGMLKMKRIFNPTGLRIAFLGPDGCGKTTVINQVKQELYPCFRRTQQFHLFPKPQTGKKVINVNPQGKKTRGLLGSVLKLLYFVGLYNWGHIRYVLPMHIKSTLTIFDRYYDDMLVDRIRYRNGAPAWIVKFFRLFIPQPNLWIVLDAPTDIIQQRKSEVPASETERQRQAYIALAQAKTNAIVINTNRDIKDISIEVCKFIVKNLNNRAIKRYKA